METELKVGMRGEARAKVTAENTAVAYGSGGVQVFATPALVGLLEAAAMDAVAGYLPEGWSTVGMEVKIKHLAPTPIGMEVVGRATLEAINGRRLVFSLEAHDGQEQVASGQHHRFLVELDKFMKKAEEKCQT